MKPKLERPIIFSGPMVRAILAGRKSQTRRVMTERHIHGKQRLTAADVQTIGEFRAAPDGTLGAYLKRFPGVSLGEVRCPHGVPGDRLWVRETFDCFAGDQFELAKQRRTIYRADPEAAPKASGRWCSPRFMPRWASRLTLEVTEVRVQRLQEISEEDAIVEGVGPVTLKPLDMYPKWMHAKLLASGPPRPQRIAFIELWDSINGKRAPWADNPWVWCISFRRLHRGSGKLW